jgi:hypothetical protein
LTERVTVVINTFKRNDMMQGNTYIYGHINVIYICIHIFECIHINIYTYPYMYTSLYACMYICILLASICMYVHL